MSLPVVVLTRPGLRQFQGGHPWIYPDHVRSADEANGALVRLEAPAGTPRGAAILGRHPGL